MSTNPPKTMNELIAALRAELGDGGLDSDHVSVERIMSLMSAYKSNAHDWEKYALFDLSRPYTRNLVDDGNGKFNLMILAWTEGKSSPIHDHSGSHCVMKVLDGALTETLYEWPDCCKSRDNSSGVDITCPDTDVEDCCEAARLMHVKKLTTLDRDDITYMHDKLGLHRITNPLVSRGSVSLHLYTPPYEVCKTFNENTGIARSSGKCLFYSKGGIKLSPNPNQAQVAVPSMNGQSCVEPAESQGMMPMVPMHVQ